jgi:hypothetical protein
MYQINTQLESNDRIVKISISESGSQLSFADVLTLLHNSTDFRHCFINCLSSVPFSAFRWETPPVTKNSSDRNFECVIIDSPSLSREPDVDAFSSYFESHKVDDVVVFPNLGNDAILIVPCPITTHSAYGHIAAFLRNAPEPQLHTFWKSVGDTTLDSLSTEPIWLNTAGAGISWLHVRLDSYPKYYTYLPYKILPGDRSN